VRDVAVVSQDVVDRAAARAIYRLGAVLDVVLWSGITVDPRFVNEAWVASGAVRRGLAGRPLGARLAAAVSLRGLRRLG
jgi:hypothetical protein